MNDHKTSTTAPASAEPAEASPQHDFALPAGYRQPERVTAVWRKAAAADAEPTDGAEHFAAATEGASSEIPYRAEMERSFGLDFSGVRAFYGRQSQLDGMGALAAAANERVAFAGGSPDRALVAHELAHVAQERRHGPADVQAKDALSSPSHPAEVEADAVAAQVVRGEKVSVRARPTALVSRNFNVTATKKMKYMTTSNGPAFAETGDVITVEDSRSAEELKVLQEAAPTTVVRISVRSQKQPIPVSGSVAIELLDFTNAMPIKTFGVRARADMKGMAEQFSGANKSRFTPQVDEKEAVGGEKKEKEKEIKIDNPDTHGGADTLFRKVVATRVDGSNIFVEFDMTTHNAYDRVHYEYVFDGTNSGRSRVHDVDPKVGNPAWDEGLDSRYGFPSKTFAGDAGAGVSRHVVIAIPKADVLGFFTKESKRTDVHCRIYVALKIWKDGRSPRLGVGPTAATKGEFEAAYGYSPISDHNDGYLRGADENGRVEFTEGVTHALDFTLADRLTEEQVWKLPIGERPSPNVSAAFPVGYAKDHAEFRPLVPSELRKEDGTIAAAAGSDSQLRLATRIENEATLRISDGETLVTLIQQLRDTGADVNKVMQSDRKLSQFKWTLSGGKQNQFTDIYMDDPALTALTAGIGIRKRMSRTDDKDVTKLNVKTGAGYNVGELASAPSTYIELDGQKSDVYRRHETGLDIDRGAEPDQIGKFLAKGVDGKDPWNRGGKEANDASHGAGGGDIDFDHLAGKMVLIGDRTKFKLEAMPIGGTNAINIEISCDHTVGRTYADYKENPKELTGKFANIYNIELELDHQGATIGASSGPSATTTNTGNAKRQAPLGVEPEAKPPVDLKQRPRMPENHPGRVYTRDDVSAPAFNTPSYEIFHLASKQLVEWMRELIAKQPRRASDVKHELPAPADELQQDHQKLESMRDMVLLGKAPPPTTARRTPAEGKEARPKSGEHRDGLRGLLGAIAEALPAVAKEIGGDKNPVDAMLVRLTALGISQLDEPLNKAPAAQAILAELGVNVTLLVPESPLPQSPCNTFTIVGRLGGPTARIVLNRAGGYAAAI